MKKLSFMFAFLAAIVLFAGSENVSAQSGSMEWNGTVDDTVQISIRGRNASTITLKGSVNYDDRYNFNGRLPRDNVSVRVEKTDGRGKVIVVQQPNRRNNWTAIVRIIDEKRSRDYYSFVLYWD